MTTNQPNVRRRLSTAKNIVVKVGTRLLTDHGKVDYDQISNLARQISQIKEQSPRVSLVSSGAIGTAMTLMNTARPIGLGMLQAYAAIGQAELIHHYNNEFAKYGHCAAQVLLTADDVNHRQKYLNLRNTFFSLFELDAIPIINENDCVATDEIAVTFGDNDRLAASVAMLVDADLLIVLSDVVGLFDRSPTEPGANRISFVESISQETFALSADASESDSGLSRGGMSSKINAAMMATSAGIPTVIAGGREKEILQRILDGEDCGTLFQAKEKNISSRKRWLKSSTDIPSGVQVDAGAVAAICQNGKSLLPIGVTNVVGRFKKGDMIFVKSPEGATIAQGVSNFSNGEADKIKQKRTEAIVSLLGKVVNEELIHRNNLVLI